MINLEGLLNGSKGSLYARLHAEVKDQEKKREQDGNPKLYAYLVRCNHEKGCGKVTRCRIIKNESGVSALTQVFICPECTKVITAE